MVTPAELPAIIARNSGKPENKPDLCQWFMFCWNDPVGTVDHSTLGEVPCCQRCADKLDLDLLTFEEKERREQADIADRYDPAEPWMDPS